MGRWNQGQLSTLHSHVTASQGQSQSHSIHHGYEALLIEVNRHMPSDMLLDMSLQLEMSHA